MMDTSDGALSTLITQIPPSALPVIAGCAAFGSTLALSTLAQLKILGVSTGSPRPIPTTIGFMSVALASLATHSACIQTKMNIKQYLPSLGSNPAELPKLPIRYTWSLGSNIDDGRKLSTSAQKNYLPGPRDSVSIGPVHIEKHTLRICALGLVAFKLLGGRFWAIAPSSYTNLGSFARFSIPATERYATPSQRSAIERLGRAVGCHTCGSKMKFRKGICFHGDHMPPKAVAEQMNKRWCRKMFGIRVKYRFFPQCVDCSAIQGAILSSATNQLKMSKWWNTPNLAGSGGGKLAHYHGLRFRPYHLAGVVVAAVTVMDASEEAIQDGNRKRYRELHEQVEEFALTLWARITSMIT